MSTIAAMGRAIVGVMGSGSAAHTELAAPLGRWIAEAGFHLLTGGGAGVMASVAEAFVGVSPRAGLSLGVLPSDAGVSPPGYPNRWVELPIVTHLPARGVDGASRESRNHVNVLTATVLVVLPGGPGTRSEAELALGYGRPAILFGPAEAFAGFPAALLRASTLDEVARFVTARA